ncbi:MAG: hypothetical protein AB7O44_27415 [Hyphomicrobiaceae bacterium]
MPERRAASLVPETADTRRPILEWGAVAGEPGGFLAQSGDNLIAQSGDNLVPQSE